MNVWVMGPEALLEEWKEPIPAGTTGLSFHYTTDKRMDFNGHKADALVYLHEELPEETTTWLKENSLSLCLINAVVKRPASIPPEFVRINGWPGFLKRPVAELAGLISDTQQQEIERLMTASGRTIEWVPDECGMPTARVLASIINEAFFALDESVSSEAEIDVAMKLGTNYPFGPFEWAKIIGHHRVVSLLSALALKEPQYLPSNRLQQTALA